MSLTPAQILTPSPSPYLVVGPVAYDAAASSSYPNKPLPSLPAAMPPTPVEDPIEIEFDWDIPDFEAFVRECDPLLCKKYLLLKKIKLSQELPLYILTPKKLEDAYGVSDPADRRHLVLHILKRLFDVNLFTVEKNRDKIDFIFWVENEDDLSEDWGISMDELEKEIGEVESFKLLYFFKIDDIKDLSPFMRRVVKAAICDEDPQQRLQANLLSSNGMVGVLAGLILAAILPMATNKQMGTFATRFSEISIVTASICTCLTFLIMVYSADNIIRLNECPIDKILLFVCSAFDRRTIFDRKFYSLNAFGYFLNLASDYLYLLLFSVVLVGISLWNWVGVYSQMYANTSYADYVMEQKQNVTEMRRYYRLDQKPISKQYDVNGQFLAINISVMILLGLLIARCAWLKVLSAVVAEIDPGKAEKNAKKREQKKRDAEKMEAEMKKKPNFGLEDKSQQMRGRALRKLAVVYFILTIIWSGVSVWCLRDALLIFYDAWKKCCLIPTFTATPTWRLF